MSILRVASTMFGTSLLLACAAGAGDAEEPVAPTDAPAVAFDPNALLDRTFTLVDLPDATASVGPATSTELAFAARPEGGYVASGHGPCNQFSSPAAFTGDGVEFVQIVSTKRACAELDVETEWFARLRAGGTVRLEGTRLSISREGKTTMVLEGRANPR